MKILVLGATGGIGGHVVRQALDQGHELTVLVRTPQKLGLSDRNLQVVQGDVLNRRDLDLAMEGVDAVISALGVPPTQQSGQLIERSSAMLVQAMQHSGVRRLVFTSGIVVKTGQLALLPRLIMRVIMRFQMADQVQDKQAGEKILRNSHLDWTLVYPTILTDGPQTAKYRYGENIKLKGFPQVSRADVADCLLKVMSQQESIRSELFVST